MQVAGTVSTPPTHEPTRQVYVVGRWRSVGQVSLVPVQRSRGSQIPREARHVAFWLPGTCAQPVAGAQVSTVQGFASSHEMPAPATQEPAAQVSPPVQRSPSSQAAPLSETQLPAELQAWQSSGSPPPQAVAQQEPSTQRPFAHIALREQVPPWAFFAAQELPWQ